MFCIIVVLNYYSKIMWITIDTYVSLLYEWYWYPVTWYYPSHGRVTLFNRILCWEGYLDRQQAWKKEQMTFLIGKRPTSEMMSDEIHIYVFRQYSNDTASMVRRLSTLKRRHRVGNILNGSKAIFMWQSILQVRKHRLWCYEEEDGLR